MCKHLNEQSILQIYVLEYHINVDQGHYHLLTEQVQYTASKKKNNKQQQQKIWTIKIQKISNISRMYFFFLRMLLVFLFLI